jgi:hypothetical protein
MLDGWQRLLSPLPTFARAVNSAARSCVFNITEATHDG